MLYVSMARASLLPLFLISAASLGFETALTRYFAIAKWSEYGYWVISIVMVGLALSGVALALARPFAERHARALLVLLPVLLLPAAAIGYRLTTANPFNPLQLQNPATLVPELGNIALYYAALLPFFFLAGLYISLVFVLSGARVGRAYGFDLSGAGAGALAIMALMQVLHPFHLIAALLVPLALAAFLGPGGWRARLAACAVFLAAEAVVLTDHAAAYDQFKPIYAPLNVPGSRVLAEIRSPRGLYALLDDFTERVDTDVSNDAGMLNLPGPPRALGLYRDGNRIAALPGPGGAATAYAAAALDALPYQLLAHPRVLLLGSSGGFRIREALTLGAASVAVQEPDPVVLRALRAGLAGGAPFPPEPCVWLHGRGLMRQAGARCRVASHRGLDVPATQPAGYDLIDMSADFLDEEESNAYAFAAEAIAADLRALAPGGLVSIPVSIRELPVYALRLLATVREALHRAGIAAPERHVVVYRSAWNARILVSLAPWSESRLAVVRRFCDDRSFDISFMPGLDPVAARATLYNDLPAVSFESGTVAAGGGPHDAIADEAGPVLRGEAVPSGASFALSPVTLDRPFLTGILRLDHLRGVLARLEILPQAELGPLVNLAVLAQAAAIALLVLVSPLAGGRRMWVPGGLMRPAVYFGALGLGFLFIEMLLIGKAGFYLNDHTLGFALVLSGMLGFSGLGSLLADRLPPEASSRALALAVAAILVWIAAMLAGLTPLLLATLGLPLMLRGVILLLLLAPVSVALGMPFPLGLAWASGAGAALKGREAELGGEAAGSGVLPWAWAVNGAFSVVATPLASLIVMQAGYSRVLAAAGLLYLLALVASPYRRKIRT
jgi:hypothetical protein